MADKTSFDTGNIFFDTDNIFFDTARIGHRGDGVIIGKTVRLRRPEACSIGVGSIIDDFVYVSCALQMGRHGHIAPNVVLSGGGARIVMGDFVGIGAGSSVHCASSDYLTASFELPSIPSDYHFGGTVADVEFADHVLIGAHSIILPGTVLPEGFACSAHSIVRNKRYEPWTLYGGPDCRKLFKRRPHAVKLQAQRLLDGLPPATAEELKNAG